uniref:Uncharacterized protein n=1 Tax=Siphoviridae sp. ctFbs2 TaxID=2826213 RepID=A0A8S5NN75_9CAUD|nr:MAG TPA: hypothetical protein [Siphoviridae sp. ctFbs2]
MQIYASTSCFVRTTCHTVQINRKKQIDTSVTAV